jgi:hypothetical protein
VLGNPDGPGGGTKMVMPDGAFGNDGGSVELKPRPLPTFPSGSPQPPPAGGPPSGDAPPAGGEGQVLAAFNVTFSREPSGATPSPAPGQTPPPPGQPTPLVEKPIQLLQKFEPPAGYQDQRNLSFFHKVEATSAGRVRLQSTADEWEKVPTLIDTVNNVAIANTNVPGDYALFDERLVAQSTYYAYVPRIQPGSLNSSVTIRNTGSASASVTLRFLKPDGSAALATDPTYTIAPSGTQLVYVPSITGLTSGSYALRISSTQPISVVSSAAQASNNASTGYGALGQDGADLVLNFPQIYREYFGFSTRLTLQNTGPTAATVSVSYLSAAGLEVATETATIPSGGSTFLDQSANTALPSPFAGSAVVTSTSRLAGIVDVSGASGQLLSTVQGVGAGAQQAFLPALYKSYFDFSSSVLIQNVDASAAKIELTYSNGTVKTATIPVGASQLYYQPAEASLPDGWQGSAVVRTTNGTRIVAVGNIQNAVTGRLSAYNAPFDGTAEVVLPALYNAYSALGFASSLTIQNVDSAATDVEIVYGDGWIQRVTGLAPGASRLVFQPSVDGLTLGWQGGAIVRSLSGKRLIAVVNVEAQGASAGAADWLSTYVGFSP